MALCSECEAFRALSYNHTTRKWFHTKLLLGLWLGLCFRLGLRLRRRVQLERCAGGDRRLQALERLRLLAVVNQLRAYASSQPANLTCAAETAGGQGSGVCAVLGMCGVQECPPHRRAACPPRPAGSSSRLRPSPAQRPACPHRRNAPGRPSRPRPPESKGVVSTGSAFKAAAQCTRLET